MTIRTLVTESADSAAKSTAQVLSPVLRRLNLQPVLYSLEKYCAFLGGKGAGSGWDHVGEVKAIANKIGSQSPVIFDVGANNGAWSQSLAAELAGREPFFYLFECSVHCISVLKTRLHDIPNSQLFEVAVSSKCGKAKMYTPNQGSGLASLHQRRDKCVVEHSYTERTVSTVTIDSMIDQAGIESVDLLKMDIEGHELAALNGASQALAQGRIKTITFEFGSGNVNSRTFFRDFWELLCMHDYRVERIIPGGHTVPVSRYTEDLEYFRGATNYMAIHQSL